MHQFLEITAIHHFAINKLIQDYINSDIYNVSPMEIKEYEDFHKEICLDYPSRGGKYLRSSLLILTAEAMGQVVAKTLLTAAAIEVSQNWLLIHDDFEDRSNERRGQPTLHLKYSAELAINAGDALQIIMWKMLHDNKDILGAEKTLRIIDEFSRMLNRTALGQTAEILLTQRNDFDFDENDYYYIIDGKSGYYTVAGPLRIGALLAEDNLEKLGNIILPQLNNFGYLLGRAFQITDDVLDLTSDFQGLKQKGNDIYESKRTIILAHLLKNATTSQREKIKLIYSKPRQDKTSQEVDYILDMMDSYGSISYAQQKAVEFAELSLLAFEKIAFFNNDKATRNLRLGVDFIINRNY